ncbi:unnamed protein product, partial [Ascophyllum nodosum]
IIVTSKVRKLDATRDVPETIMHIYTGRVSQQSPFSQKRTTYGAWLGTSDHQAINAVQGWGIVCNKPSSLLYECCNASPHQSGLSVFSIDDLSAELSRTIATAELTAEGASGRTITFDHGNAWPGPSGFI